MKQLWLGLLATLITLPIPCQARPNQEGAYEFSRAVVPCHFAVGGRPSGFARSR